MDHEYNQYEVDGENMGDALNYLEEGMPCEVVMYNGRAISVELPTTLVRQGRHLRQGAQARPHQAHRLRGAGARFRRDR